MAWTDGGKACTGTAWLYSQAVRVWRAPGTG
jgi:hypothetical protein